VSNILGRGFAGVHKKSRVPVKSFFGAKRACNSGGTSYIHVGNGRHNRNDAIGFRDTDVGSTAQLLHADNWKRDCAVPDAVGTTSNVIHDRFSRHKHPGAAATRSTTSAVAFHHGNARTGAIDGTEHCLHVHVGQYSHNDVIGYDDVAGRDDDSVTVGGHSHANRHHHVRERLANDPAWRPIDRMQLDTGRPADQWRGVAAFESGYSCKPATRNDPTRHYAAWRHEHRSDNDRSAHAEHVGMCESTTMNLATPGTMTPANAAGAAATLGVSPPGC
jgi:hypothetical protein